MAQEISKKVLSIFEQIKHTDENSNEFWMARQLAKVLEYSDFRNFNSVIEKAKEACKNSGQPIEDHLVEFNEEISHGKGALVSYPSYKLSRYACYLIVQNADPSKEVVTLGQTYFAVQTRLDENYPEILRQAVAEINAAKIQVAKQINATAISVYWNLGKLLSEQKIEKGHGAGVVNRLSVDLKTEFPDMGLSPRNLWDMKRFFECYHQADAKLRQAVAVLPWGHNLLIMNRLILLLMNMKMVILILLLI